MKDVGFSINDTLYDAYKNSSTSRVASNNLTISGGPNSTGDFNALSHEFDQRSKHECYGRVNHAVVADRTVCH